jgi:hypothetical protein
LDFSVFWSTQQIERKMAAVAAALALRSTDSSIHGSFAIKRASNALPIRNLPDESTWEGCFDMELLMLDRYDLL